MKLSEQVCALEQAKKLYALGVERRSLFYHFNGRIENEAFGSEYYCAFTVAELGEMLPDICHTMKANNSWACFYRDTIKNKYKIELGPTEAEARAAMLIYLLENSLVTPAEINQRLTQK